MPPLSPTMEDATLDRWLVAEGDTVEAGDVIAEVTTDKATLEIEVDRAGVIVRLLVSEGAAGVRVNAPIALLEQSRATDPPKPGINRPARRPGRSTPDASCGALQTVREALRDALAEEMERDPSVFLIGEGIGVGHGSYSVTEGLLERFGSRRVVDAPPYPASVTGLAIGAAMAGLRPIVEFQNFSFALQAMDQIINNAGKLRFISSGAVSCPVVLRGPNGSAGGVGAQYGQDMASLLARHPGLKVVAPCFADDAKALLKGAIRDPDPVIVIESEALYGTSFSQFVSATQPPSLGSARIVREGSDISLVAYGSGVLLALEAAEVLGDSGVGAEVVDLRSLAPLDVKTIAASVRKTSRCLSIDESTPSGGFADRIAAALMRELFDCLKAPVEAVTAADAPTPYAPSLEAEWRVSASKIVAAAQRLLAK